MRAARALLEWEQREVATRTGLSVPTIQRMESLGLGRSSAANAERVQRAFEAAGIEFLDDDAPGVRLHSQPLRRNSAPQDMPRPSQRSSDWQAETPSPPLSREGFDSPNPGNLARLDIGISHI